MERQVRVWDPLLRVLHWGLAASVLTAILTEGEPAWLHDNAGYVALSVVALRLVWGFLGPPEARFAGFLSGPRATLAYLGRVIRGREERHLGHNPLGGWMIVALLLGVAGAGATGWLSTTDAFWGNDTVAGLHGLFGDAVTGLILLHLAGVVFTSLRQGENLVRAMVTGRKPAATRRHPEGDAGPV